MLQNFTDEELEELPDIGWLTASDGSHRRIDTGASPIGPYYLQAVSYNRYYPTLSALLSGEGLTYDDLRASWIYRGTLFNSPVFLDKLVHDQICPCPRCIPDDFIAWCKAVVSRPDRWAIADTETTGLYEPKIDIVDLALLGTDGTELYNSILRPVVPITHDAAKTHHITEEVAARAPLLEDEWLHICGLIENRTIITWNVKFDQARIEQAMRLHGLNACSDYRWRYDCAMIRYSNFYEEPNRKGYRGYQWQRLGDACYQQGIMLPPNLHRALPDCQATLALLRQVAAAGENAARYR